MREIERKFRLSALPSPEIRGEGVIVLQGYIATDPTESRLRRKGAHHYLTVKGRGGLSREEWEGEVPATVFDALWPRTEGRIIEKTRYTIMHAGLTVELDDYHGTLSGLITLECEFPTKEMAATWTLPSWAEGATDVTTNSAYKNKKLAVDGLPADLREGRDISRLLG